MSKTYFDNALLRANTEAGKAWLQTYAHPPGGKGDNYAGYPDASTVPAVHPFHVPVVEGDWLAETPDGTAPAMCFLASPGLFGPVYRAGSINESGVIGTNLGNAWSQVNQNTDLDPVWFTTGYTRFRNTARSSTFQLDATALNDKGMVYVAQISPGVYTLTQFQLAMRFREYGQFDELAKLRDSYIRSPRADRFIKRKRAEILDCIDTGVCPPMPLDKFDACLDTVKKGLTIDKRDSHWAHYVPFIDLVMAADSTEMVQVAKLGKMVTKPSDFTDMSPRCYASQARDGAFTVNSVNNPTNDFQDLGLGYYDGAATNEDLYLCYYETFLHGAPKIVGFGTEVAGDPVQRDTSWRNWTWSLVFFYNVTPGTDIAAINIKSNIHYEATVAPRGPFQPFVRIPAMFDPLALECAAMIVQARMDGMPASYNVSGELGTQGLANQILGSAAGALSEGIKNIDKNITKKEEREIDKSFENTTSPNDSATPTTSDSQPAGRPAKQNAGLPRGKTTVQHRPPKKVIQVSDVNKRLNELERALKNVNVQTKPKQQPRNWDQPGKPNRRPGKNARQKARKAQQNSAS